MVRGAHWTRGSGLGLFLPAPGPLKQPLQRPVVPGNMEAVRPSVKVERDLLPAVRPKLLTFTPIPWPHPRLKQQHQSTLTRHRGQFNLPRPSSELPEFQEIVAPPNLELRRPR